MPLLLQDCGENTSGQSVLALAESLSKIKAGLQDPF